MSKSPLSWKTLLYFLLTMLKVKVGLQPQYLQNGLKLSSNTAMILQTMLNGPYLILKANIYAPNDAN